jgi:hypothetical protein
MNHKGPFVGALHQRNQRPARFHDAPDADLTHIETGDAIDVLGGGHLRLGSAERIEEWVAASSRLVGIHVSRHSFFNLPRW